MTGAAPDSEKTSWTVRVGAAQIKSHLGRVDDNVAKICKWIREAAAAGVQLLVFPEASVTGIAFDTAQQVERLAVPVPGDLTRQLSDEAGRNHVNVVLGLIERDGSAVYNSVVYLREDGYVGTYRKSHTLCLGLDRFVSRGDSLQPFAFGEWSIGCLICYDQRFPEAARTLALQGADILCHSAGLPTGTECYQDLLNPTRACENRVFLISADSVGAEGNVTYAGRSQIIDCFGHVLAEGSRDKEELLVAEIDPSPAKGKRTVIRSGEYEFDLFDDRRPDLYRTLVSIRDQDAESAAGACQAE